MKFLAFKKLIIIGLALFITLDMTTTSASSSNVNMDRIHDYANSVSYRTGDLLCYVFTYYKKGEAPYGRMVTSPIPHDPFVDDAKYKRGVFEWGFIDRNTFKSAILTDDEHKYFYLSLHSQYVQNLIEADGFREAIRRCATARNLDFEDLFERITNTMLFVDGHATLRGRLIQTYLLGKIFGFALKGVLKLTEYLGRITGLGRLGVATATVTVFQQGDSAYYQIWKSHQESLQQAEEQTQRWQHYNQLISNVQNATSADAQTALINLYFIDYWMLQRELDALRDERMQAGSFNESAEELKLNMIFEMFAFRKSELDRRLESPHPTHSDIVAKLLLNRSENDPHFKCHFEDNSPSLCRLHLLYLAQSRQNLNTPQQIQELQALENQFANEISNGL